MRKWCKLWQIGDTYKLCVFKYPPQKKEKAFQPFPFELLSDDEKAERLSQSLSRARRNVRELLLCNSWQYFVTLTLRENRYDLHAFKKAFSVWVGNFNKKYNTKLQYVVIPEEHKDGATHAHGVFAGVPESALCTNEHGYLTIPYYENRFGFISLSAIRDSRRCASYVAKYITKKPHSQLKKGEQMFFASHGLKRAEPLGVWCLDEKLLPTEPHFQNEYVEITAGEGEIPEPFKSLILWGHGGE